MDHLQQTMDVIVGGVLSGSSLLSQYARSVEFTWPCQNWDCCMICVEAVDEDHVEVPTMLDEHSMMEVPLAFIPSEECSAYLSECGRKENV